MNVGQAKTDLSKLLARVEAGEAVEIVRDGVPVAWLVRIELSSSAGRRFLAARGSLAGPAIGRLSAPHDLSTYCEAAFRSSASTPIMASRSRISRCIIVIHSTDCSSQARCEQLTMVTADGRIADYDVSLIDAG
ncbi:MAG: type II toxin-antitoxin system prevent-host-death family antitoxin [Geodermatophilaceae bacterium]